MKTVLRLTTSMITIALLTACSSGGQGTEKETSRPDHHATQTEPDKHQDTEEETEPEADNSEAAEVEEGKNEAQESMTQAEVIQAVVEEIDTDLSLTLPEKLPLDEGKHLTATTEGDASSYQVIFFESENPIPINHKQLGSEDDAAHQIAAIHVQQYDTQEEADEAISFETFEDSGRQEVDLGYDITGYQDAGAGSIYTGWNEGRWALAVHTQTDEAESGTKLAKDAVAYLEENTLPVPEPHGYAHLDVAHEDNRILWEKGKTVFTLDEVENPMNALEIAVQLQ